MPNALAREKSPYLLQHAHNPVEWLPWGDDAFERARREDKLIFLSIGYSTCHWCHVMERESFENDATAALMNELFVNVKVDREERPDVDATYMAFVMATTGHGGWPMSVWLTPELRPIYGGTYYPPEDRTGRAGFPSILRRVAEAWEKDRETIRSGAGRSVEAIASVHETPAALDDLPGEGAFDTAFEQLARLHDAEHGGFGRAPKFPRASLFTLLARLAERFGAESQRGRRCRHMLVHTLAAMAQGGIHDHLGGGFHRYSVDTWWHVPHFEKMLYDQAQLAVSYLEAWQLTGDPLFRRTCEGIFDYVRRDLTAPEGGFFSAEDADSLPTPDAPEKLEGAFYTWTLDEVERRLPGEAARFFAWSHWVLPEGNARPQSDPLGELAGRNTLFVAHDVREAAEHFGKSAEETRSLHQTAREILLAARNERPRPHLDDKIVTAWNGLMVSAFVRAAAVWQRADWAEAARQALRFLRRELWDAGAGALRRSFREGPGAAPGFAPDHAFLIQGCLDAYESLGEVEWLRWAVELQERFDRHFWSEDHGGYVLAPHGQKDTLVPLREHHDGAEPSPNSVAALNLLRLAALLDDRRHRARAETLLRSAGALVTESPFSVPCLTAALDFARSAPTEVVVTTGSGHAEMLAAVHAGFFPNKVVLHADGAEGQLWLAERVPSLALMKPVGGKSTVYVCRNFTCEAPVTEPAAVRLGSGPSNGSVTKLLG